MKINYKIKDRPELKVGGWARHKGYTDAWIIGDIRGSDMRFKVDGSFRPINTVEPVFENMPGIHYNR